MHLLLQATALPQQDHHHRLLHQCSIVTQKTIQTKEFLTKMKRVGSIKQALKPSLKSSSSHNHSSSSSDATNNNESTKMQSGVSILGNAAANVSNGSGHHSKPDFHLPKSISSFLKKGSNTLTRKKDKANQNREAIESEFSYKSCLPPPMPPVAPNPSKLRRISSSTLSLSGRTKKKLLTMEELYVEILYTILHMIGCDAEKTETNALVEHLKDAFHMEDEKHQKLLDIATMREEPYLKANVEIFEARGLLGKDMLGSSDPYCTFYLTTNPLTRYNTSYKPKTLDPTWNEDFVLDVNSVEHDNLRIDVWDFNPEENVSEKFKKFGDIKDSRGLRKFIKETLHASAGKTTYDLLGSVEIPLKDIPSSGIERWYALQKPDGGKSKRQRGDIRVGLTLSTEKDQNVTSHEHRHLLKILFAHELQRTQAESFSWEGTLSQEAITILAQHAVQGKLTGADTAMARWLVFAYTHHDLPLDYRVFIPTLEKLHYALLNNLFHQEEETRFLDVAAMFVQNCIEYVRKHRHFMDEEPEKHAVQLEYALKNLHLLNKTVEVTDENDMSLRLKKLPIMDLHGNAKSHQSLPMQVQWATISSLEDWYHFIFDKMPLETNRLLKLKNITEMVNFLNNDLRGTCVTFQKFFHDSLGMDYSRMAFEIYEKQLTEASHELIETSCDKLRPVIFGSDNDYVDDTMTTGTTLFELYLALQQFCELGQQVFRGVARATEMSNNHSWFTKAVARWLEIALFKAMERITKAVELDELSPVDEFVKHSSSAVDIKTVLVQIKTFWQQLNWPDVEASYAFISKILDDVCKTTIFYADHMCKRVLNQENDNKKVTFEVTPQLCLAINNIDYVLQYIRPFVNELGIEEIVEKLRVLNGDLVANSCKRTLQTLVHNAVDNVENKIFEVLDLIGEKMAPVIQKFLVEGCSLVAYAGRNMDSLINYLDKNLILLKDKLNTTNFDRVLSVIWQCSALSLHDTISLSIERRKPPSYFKTLLDILRILIKFFYADKVPNDETLLKMEAQLQLYASDSHILISRYLFERHREQKAMTEFPLGSVNIRVQLLREHLRVEVLNARHLKPPDPRSVRIRENKYLPAQRRRLLQSSANLSRSQRNLEWVKSKFKSLRSNLHEASVQLHNNTNDGLCDPYISLRLLPGQKFPECPKHKTRWQRRTLFPLYDETFDFVLRYEPHRFHDAYLQIQIKDRGFLGNGLFLGEAFLPLNELRLGDLDQRLSDLPQIQLPLSKPSGFDSDVMLALDSRHFDQVAKQFLQKEKRKL